MILGTPGDITKLPQHIFGKRCAICESILDNQYVTLPKEKKVIYSFPEPVWPPGWRISPCARLRAVAGWALSGSNFGTNDVGQVSLANSFVRTARLIICQLALRSAWTGEVMNPTAQVGLEPLMKAIAPAWQPYHGWGEAIH